MLRKDMLLGQICLLGGALCSDARKESLDLPLPQVYVGEPVENAHVTLEGNAEASRGGYLPNGTSFVIYALSIALEPTH